MKTQDDITTKSAGKTFDEDDFNSLQNLLTSDTYDTVTINKIDITLSGSIL